MNRLCADIISSFNSLDESQPRNIEAWRPVVVDVLEGLVHFSPADFEKHIDTFYPLGVELLSREPGPEVRGALQGMLRRIGECRMGMPPAPSPQERGTPTSPGSLGERYFATRRNSRGRS